MQHAKNMEKYIICELFPTIFYIENTFLLSLLLIPNTPVTMVTAQQKMEIKSWDYTDTNSEVSMCV